MRPCSRLLPIRHRDACMVDHALILLLELIENLRQKAIHLRDDKGPRVALHAQFVVVGLLALRHGTVERSHEVGRPSVLGEVLAEEGEDAGMRLDPPDIHAVPQLEICARRIEHGVVGAADSAVELARLEQQPGRGGRVARSS